MRSLMKKFFTYDLVFEIETFIGGVKHKFTQAIVQTHHCLKMGNVFCCRNMNNSFKMVNSAQLFSNCYSLLSIMEFNNLLNDKIPSNLSTDNIV